MVRWRVSAVTRLRHVMKKEVSLVSRRDRCKECVRCDRPRGTPP
ncbi:hypothetical protein [Laspinema sp. D2d]|nr:hypothetical protein [Laspinema sp. D2d]